MVETLILLGPPGSGKGTQAELLGDGLGFEVLSTGALLRAAREAGTETGRRAAAYMDRGDLVPDGLVAAVVEHAIAELAGRRVILDGFPRTVEQARSLDHARGERRVDAVVLIDVPDDEVVRRIVNRRQGRSDDTAETARARLDVYHRETEPLADHYDERGLLRRVDGAGAPDSVAAEIRAAIA